MFEKKLVSRDIITDYGALKELVDNYIMFEVPKLNKLENYYLGKQGILGREFNEGVLQTANNKITNNICKRITDNLTGYWIGKPIQYENIDKEVYAQLRTFDIKNDVDKLNYETAKDCSIFGRAYNIMFVDSDSEIRIGLSDPRNTFMLCDIDDFLHTQFAGVRFSKSTNESTKKSVYRITVITKNEYIEWVIEEDGKEVRADEPTINKHSFSSLPIIEILNNENGIGDFESVLDLQDALNVITSDRVNSVENAVHSLLVLKGYESLNDDTGLSEAMNYISEEQKQFLLEYRRYKMSLIKQLKNAGVLSLQDGGDAKFIGTSLNGGDAKVLADDIIKYALQIANCPDFSDENFFGNASSGVALQYKLVGINQISLVKENYFTNNLLKRLELLKNHTKGIKDLDLINIQIKYTKNLPVNEEEIINRVVKLNGVVSDSKLLEWLKPLGVDPETELKRIKDELNSGEGEY